MYVVYMCVVERGSPTGLAIDGIRDFEGKEVWVWNLRPKQAASSNPTHRMIQSGHG